MAFSARVLYLLLEAADVTSSTKAKLLISDSVVVVTDGTWQVSLRGTRLYATRSGRAVNYRVELPPMFNLYVDDELEVLIAPCKTSNLNGIFQLDDNSSEIADAIKTALYEKHHLALASQNATMRKEA
jgi:hypothetical protein